MYFSCRNIFVQNAAIVLTIKCNPKCHGLVFVVSRLPAKMLRHQLPTSYSPLFFCVFVGANLARAALVVGVLLCLRYFGAV